MSIQQRAQRVKIIAPNGRAVFPYSIEGPVLIKRVQDRHIFRARQAVGIDEAIWIKFKSRVHIVRFEFPDGSAREISSKDFESLSFVHGDGLSFAVTRFIPIALLRLVRERPPARGQLALALGA